MPALPDVPDLPGSAVFTPAADKALAAPGMQELIDDVEHHAQDPHLDYDHEKPEPLPLTAAAGSPARLQLKLYGKEAAHTWKLARIAGAPASWARMSSRSSRRAPCPAAAMTGDASSLFS